MPVVGKTADELRERARFFQHAIDRVCALPPYSDGALLYHPRIGETLATCYFALSEAYKRRRLPPGARSHPSKIAALTTVTIAAVQPLRVREPNAVESEEFLYANPILAMRCGCSIVAHPFHKASFDHRRRFYKMFAEVSIPSIDAIIQESNEKDSNITTLWNIDLSRAELAFLDSKVTMFEVLGGMKIYKDYLAAKPPDELLD